MLVVIARGPIEHGIQNTRVFGPYLLKELAYTHADQINNELEDWQADVLMLISKTPDGASVGDYVADFITDKKGG